MSLWLIIVLVTFATHRVTRVITRDSLPIIAIPREAFAQRWAAFNDADDKSVSIGGKHTNVFMRSLAYLWECDWCASVWVSAGITFGAYRLTELGDHHWFISILVGLAASTGTGLIAQREPD